MFEVIHGLATEVDLAPVIADAHELMTNLIEQRALHDYDEGDVHDYDYCYDTWEFLGSGFYSWTFKHKASGLAVKFGGVGEGGLDAYPVYAKKCVDNPGARFTPDIMYLEEVHGDAYGDDYYIVIMPCYRSARLLTIYGDDVPPIAVAMNLLESVIYHCYNRPDEVHTPRSLSNTTKIIGYSTLVNAIKRFEKDLTDENLRMKFFGCTRLYDILAVCLDYIELLPKFSAIDIHGGNWMLTYDDNMVITDPVSYIGADR